MSDKLNENTTPETLEELTEETAEEINAAVGDNAVEETEETYDVHNPKLEENDNWEFEAEAPTLSDTLIQDGEIEISIPSSSVAQTRERPTAVKNEEAPAAAAPKKKGDSKNAALFFTIAVLVLICAGVLAFFGIRYYSVPNNTEVMNPGNVALTVDGTDVSVGMYNYYYKTTVNYYVQQASYGNAELDTTKDYDKQETTDYDGNTITWAEKFKQDTIEQIKRLVFYYNGAVKNNITLTDEQKESIEKDIDSLKESADSANQSVDEYISANYGQYCGVATLRKMEEMSYAAQSYLREYTITLVPSDEDVEAYYQEHQDDYLQVDISYLVMPFDETSRETVTADAEKYASQVKSTEDLKKLIPVACKDLIDGYVAQGYGDADSVAEQIAASTELSVTKSNPNQLPEDIIEWLFSDGVPASSCKSFVDENYQAAFIIFKSTAVDIADDPVYSVRHILIMPETDSQETEEGEEAEETAAEPTEEQWAAAEKKAQEVLDEYNKGDKTEYAFAQLAEKYSSDTASLSSGGSNYGGLYTNVSLGQMVSEFENWAIDDSRKYGDTDIVKSQFGYHIMYFVDKAPRYIAECKIAVQMKMEDDAVAAAEVKERHAMKKVDVAKPETEQDTAQSTTQDATVPDDAAAAEDAADTADTTDTADAADAADTTDTAESETQPADTAE